MIAVQLINDEALLNNFFTVDAKEYVPGEAVKVKFQILDPQSKQRLIPDGAALMSVVFQNSDGTFLTKSATFLFDPDDKSCWEVDLTASESIAVVGGNFKVILDFLGDATDIRSGMVTFDGEC